MYPIFVRDSSQKISMYKLLLFIVCLLQLPNLYGQNETLQQQPALMASISGNYKGKAPCTDCDIIETELELDYDTDSTGHFSLRDKYVSKKGSDMMSRIKGEWMLVRSNADARSVWLVELNYDTPEKAIYYLVKPDGTLQPLDSERKPISAPIDCTLKKT